MGPKSTNSLPKSLEGFSLSAEQLLIFQHVITVDTVNQASPFAFASGKEGMEKNKRIKLSQLRLKMSKPHCPVR